MYNARQIARNPTSGPHSAQAGYRNIRQNSCLHVTTTSMATVVLPHSRVCGLRQRRSINAYVSWKQGCYSNTTETRRRPTTAFRFFKMLGIKKPAFLPDFGREKRKNLLLDFFNHPGDRRKLEEYLADECAIKEERDPNIVYSRSQYIDLMCNRIAPAIPDFTWTPDTDGVVDDDGYAIVEIQAAGHHSGAPLEFPNLEPLPATGRRFHLPGGHLKVKVTDGKIQEIVGLKSNPGPLALYEELRG